MLFAYLPPLKNIPFFGCSDAPIDLWSLKRSAVDCIWILALALLLSFSCIWLKKHIFGWHRFCRCLHKSNHLVFPMHRWTTYTMRMRIVAPSSLLVFPRQLVLLHPLTNSRRPSVPLRSYSRYNSRVVQINLKPRRTVFYSGCPTLRPAIQIEPAPVSTELFWIIAPSGRCG